MKKSLIALLVVVALVITVSVFSVGAEETTTDYTLTITDGVATAACPCSEHKGDTATFTALTAEPTATGHYYLSDNFSGGMMKPDANTQVVLHLNGHTYQRTSQGAAVQLLGGTTLTVLDNPANEGGIKDRDVEGSANTWGGYGGIIQVTNSDTTVNIYGGTYTCAETTRAVNGAVIGISNATNVVNIYGGVFEGTASYTGSLGGAFAISAGTLNLYGGTIQNSVAPNGAGIYATGANSKIVIDGGTIQNCAATDRGGSISVVGGASLEVKSGTITGGSAAGTQLGGNIYSEGSGSITISGGEISNGYTWNGTTAPTPIYDETDTTKVIGYSTSSGGGRGGNIITRNTVKLVISGGTISGGSAPAGGNLSVEANNADSNLSGGTISGGYASSKGGNMYVNGTSSVRALLKLSGANFSGGKSANGGSIYMNSYGTVTMSAGTIDGGYATTNGGNLMFNSGSCTFEMSDGTISNGTAAGSTSYGGNICVRAVATVLNLTGGTISGGKSVTAGGNIYINALGSGSVFKNLTIKQGVSKAGGNLYTEKTLTLENCTLDQGSANNGGNLHVAASAATVTLNNTKVNNGKSGTGVSGTINMIYGAGVYVKAGTVKLTNGSSMYKNVAMHGGSVYLDGPDAYFTMEAGTTIDEGEAQRNSTTVPYGGNVAVMSGKFTMNGGTISNGEVKNSSSNASGGNVYVGYIATTVDGVTTYTTGEFEMVDGTISGGKCKTRGANVYIVGGDADTLGLFTMQNGTIKDGVSSNNHGGVSVADFGKFIMNDGLVTNNDSTYSGANIGVLSITADNPAYLDINGGTISDGTCGAYSGNILLGLDAEATIDGATISGGTATYGGNIVILASATSAAINNCTITGGTATSTTTQQGGGNIWNALGATTITDCVISDGTASGAQGGNISNSGAGAQITGCRIIGGTAGTRVATETTDEETGETVVTYSYPNGNGRGGNIAIFANTTLEKCVIKEGTSYSSGGGGGNIYINGGTAITITSCNIEDGFAQNTGGNIQHHAAATLTINGDSYIAGGQIGSNFGSNITVGSQGAAVLKIEGNTTVSQAGCNAIGYGGVNIHMPGTQQLYLGENARIIGGTHSIVLGGAGKVYLSGNSYMEGYIELRVSSASTAPTTDSVIAQEGFTGDALVIVTTSSSYTTDANTSIVVGATVYDALGQEEGYANTGTIKVHDSGRNGFVVSDTGSEFIVAGYTGFKTLNAGTDTETVVEYGLADLSDVSGYEYVKLYCANNTVITLNESLDGMPIDLNNKIVSFETNGYTLAPIDYRTDSGVVAKYTQYTVDNEDDIQLLVTNPTTGYKYLNIKDEDAGTWTSNRIRVEMTKVSIKTTKDGIYYTTRIVTNANVAPYLVDYGTAVSLVQDVVIDENFLDNLDTNGVLYTAFGLEETGNINITTRSALISGILSEGATDPTNDERCGYTITANSYVTAIVDGQEVMIMAEEGSALSMKDIMIKLDDKIAELDVVDDAATITTAVNFYNKWADPFATWDCLPNLKSAAEAAA